MRASFLDAMGALRGESSTADYALTAEAAAWLAAYIRRTSPRSLLELGSGFSTMALGYACAMAGGVRFLSADHDGRWLSDVKAISLSRAMEDGKRGDIVAQEPEWWHVDALRVAPKQLDAFGLKGAFDLVLVDHGPTMETRLDDLPWISSLLAEGGVMVLDDCRDITRYERRARAILVPMGWEIQREPESYAEKRWLGIARRKPATSG
jgi:predicted O-methyltransferase YrrM